MNRVLLFTSLLFTLSFAACSKQPVATPPEAAPANANVQSLPTATPVVNPTAVAPTGSTPSPGTVVMPTPGTSVAPPVVPNAKDGGKQAKAEQKPLPPDLWQRMTRPLSVEEINKLPPETRDMILRAQGRLPASPAPKKK